MVEIATHSLETAIQALSRKTWKEFRFETPSWPLILLTTLSHLNVRVRNCHREEGALRLTRRSHAVDWAAAPGLMA